MRASDGLWLFSCIMSAVFAGGMLTIFAVLKAVETQSWTMAVLVPLAIIIGLDAAIALMRLIESRRNREVER